LDAERMEKGEEVGEKEDYIEGVGGEGDVE